MRQPRQARTPEDRAQEIVTKRRQRVRRKYKDTAHKGSKPRMPGEIDFKKEMSIILTLGGFTHKEIGLSLGESRQTITAWLNEPEIQKKFQKIADALPVAARTLLETYTVEAVHALVDIMRSNPNDKYVLEAAKEILDRGGLPKISRNERKEEHVENFNIGDPEGIVERLRHAPPEIQEKAAGIVEQFEMLLAEHPQLPPSKEGEEVDGAN